VVAVDAEEEVELSLSGDGEVDGVEGMVAESEGMLIISVSRMSVFCVEVVLVGDISLGVSLVLDGIMLRSSWVSWLRSCW
jgi:hypothetical protein